MFGWDSTSGAIQREDHGIARRANAILLLDDGKSCQEIAAFLYLDNDTVRGWYKTYRREGWEALALDGWKGGQPRITREQERALSVWLEERFCPFDTGDQAKPAFGWVKVGPNPGLKTTAGRGRVNSHGALNLETFDAPFVEPTTVDGLSAVQLLSKIDARNPDKRVVHVIWDNAAY